MRNPSRGQTTLEYSLLLAAIVAGLIMMQIYAKRGLMGKYHQISESIGSQYSPGHTVASFSSTTTTSTTENTSGGVTTVTTPLERKTTVVVDSTTRW